MEDSKEESHGTKERVNSQAVVKFSAVQVPVKFNTLECNTNLNLPPSNWLTTSESSCGLHQALYQTPGFASFRMAHMFPDCVGEVDVVSDAENIKKLLKMPYTPKGAISMMVHKVGNTLLLDEFDIQKYLLRKADDDWKWLRTFILERLLAYGQKEQNFCLKDKSREALQTKNLLSKFLYHSLKQTGSANSCTAQEKHRHLPVAGPVLPEPKVEENVPDPKSNHVFNRNVVWTFEDIRMLIGTDMPIFGGPNRPCISLRLRDVAKPINVLTGIDYWLDNLMCNVPEVLMCYHLDGIVQKYEIIKTEDLPYLEDSKFSPKFVRNMAQNILAFLKAKATKSGHTYWLFKGRNDDVVKLYDLTTLCEQETGTNDCEEKLGNPFTVPVAMLLYTVARNMKNTSANISPKRAGNIRALLENCIKLLPKEKYPQIVSSSHYILSDLHIPTGIDPKAPNLENFDKDNDSVYDEDEDELEDSEDEQEFTFSNLSETLKKNSELHDNITMQNICETLKELDVKDVSKDAKRAAARAPLPLIADIEQRCEISLQHVSDGLKCLLHSNATEEDFIKASEEFAKNEKARKLHEEQNPQMATPFNPIPLPYLSLSPQKDTNAQAEEEPELTTENKTQNKTKTNKKTKSKRKKSKDSEEPEKAVAINFNTHLFGSWNVHLKLLLLEKAYLSYYTLAEQYFQACKFGAALKAIYMCCRCHLTVKKHMSIIVSQTSCLMGRAGDCFIQMSKMENVMDKLHEEYNEMNEHDVVINRELTKELCGEDLRFLIKPARGTLQLLASGLSCYEYSLQHLPKVALDDTEPQRVEVLRRLGSARNEIGLQYMYRAEENFTNNLSAPAADLEEDIRFEKVKPKKKFEKKDQTESNTKILQLAYEYLTSAADYFIKIKDNLNLSLVYCNLGRFMRLRGHIQSEINLDDVQEVKKSYTESFAYYQKALDVLESREENQHAWDITSWQMSTAVFMLAKYLQDKGYTKTPTRAEQERAVLDTLQKSLKLCPIDIPSTQQVLYLYRAANIHQRISSLLHLQLREGRCVQSKATIQICKSHYEKAADMFKSLKEVEHLLALQLERGSLEEFQYINANNTSQKVKFMQNKLEIFLQSKVAFETAVAVNCAFNNAPELKEDFAEQFTDHMIIFVDAIQNTLKTLNQLLLTTKDTNKLVDLYKALYRETLMITKTPGEQNITPTEYAGMILEMLEKIDAKQRAHAKAF